MTTPANKIGYVYKIVCLDTEIKDCYVGSCQSFRTRKNSHKSNCNNSNNKEYNYNVYQFIRANGGWSNFSMLVIEQVNFTVKHELLIKERFHLEHLKASLNKLVPTRTVQEYYEKNKTEINEKQKEIITCDCGKSLTKGAISHHNKSRRHQNYIANLPQVIEREMAGTVETVL